MFLDLDKNPSSNLAVIERSGSQLTYGELIADIGRISKMDLPRSVVFCLCENSIGSLVGYLAFMEQRMIPLLLSSHIDPMLLEKLDAEYAPSYYWKPIESAACEGGRAILSMHGYELIATDNAPYPVNDSLSMLLTTSGSTGSNKLVRHKYGNLETNARNVANAFVWTPSDRGICDLPMNYTMGLNVINSHLIAGACVLFPQANLMSPLFWDFIDEERGTTFCGVPYSYEVIRRLGLERLNTSHLKTLAQGGGKLSDQLFESLADFCETNSMRFVATFGTTETSARITMLPPKLATKKTGSIGWAIPGCEAYLANVNVDEMGRSVGELVCEGPNVTMGYAYDRNDLMKGDEFKSIYHTGDIATCDEDNCLYIVGRTNRFLKLFGFRVSLDEMEALIRTNLGYDCACAGDDSKMLIFITDESRKDETKSFVSSITNITGSAIKVIALEELPRNEYGKIRYSELRND